MAFASVLGFLANLESSVGLDAFPKYRQGGAEKSDAPFLLFFVGFTLLVYLLETYLDLRQHRNLKVGTPPSTLLEVLKTVDEDNKGLEAVSKVESKFSASQAYGLDKSRFHFFDSTFDLFVGLTTNLLGWMPWLWDVSSGLVAKAGLGDWGGDIPTSLTFVVLTMTLIGLPFSLYSTFVVEAKHGFNKQTLGLFFADKTRFSIAVMAPGGGVQRAGEEHAAHGRHQYPGVELRAEDHRARGQAFLRLRVGLHVLFLHPHAHDCAHSHHADVQHLLSP
ncbi:unnamed protein product [Ectocarpus sp. 6 AP-2014]